MRILGKALFGAIFVAVPLSAVQPVAAETLPHRAENQVPVAIV